MEALFLALTHLSFTVRALGCPELAKPSEERDECRGCECCAFVGLRYEVLAGGCRVGLLERVHNRWYWSFPYSQMRFPVLGVGDPGPWGEPPSEKHQAYAFAALRANLRLNAEDNCGAYLLAMLTGERRPLEAEMD